ncbi:L-lactate dehydrogenase [Paenibacillus thermoaerophilus]|uniref:L-lactate dehydrogenase n=1 Tax=Paenibacillus thermoaerophilus TaxID=1215385 RepID=A0ABW2V803_9BACL|nr:L-lactate dehydrogenase [Paenibacillus thermoaerophilus]TMV17834.1 L-lactate dehydrogenase [Paenibacillus thermoaerophilus]
MIPQSDKARRKIVVVGAGAVGSTTAYTLFLRERATELVLIDVNMDKAKGDALDMNHGLPFVGQTSIRASGYEECADADIVIVTAGAAQRPGETRTDLLKRNLAIFDEILTNVMASGSEAILLIATNPVDLMTQYSQRVTGWPAHRVIGSGTLLDSARFRYRISRELGVDPRSVHASIIGEHGDSEVPVWSLANVAGMPVSLPEERKKEVFVDTRDAAYEIIAAKGATYYAIALALDRICAAILNNEGSVLNVSAKLDGQYGLNDVYAGVPCVVDRTGVRSILELPLQPEELEGLRRSAEKLTNLARETFPAKRI